MSDIVERLRSDDRWLRKAGGFPGHHHTISGLAAAEITRLRARVAELEEGLRPFAEYMSKGLDLDHKGDPLPDEQGVGWVYLTMSDFRRARALTKGGE